MLVVVPISIARRTQYAEEVGGVYCEEEIVASSSCAARWASGRRCVLDMEAALLLTLFALFARGIFESWLRVDMRDAGCGRCEEGNTVIDGIVNHKHYQGKQTRNVSGEVRLYFMQVSERNLKRHVCVPTRGTFVS